MRKKILCAAVAAAALLSGCTETSKPSEPASSAESGENAYNPGAAQSVPAQSSSAQSVNSGAPTVIAPSFTSTAENVITPDPKPVDPDTSFSTEVVDGTVRTDGLNVPAGSYVQIGGSESNFEEDTVIINAGGSMNIDGIVYIAQGCKLILEPDSVADLNGSLTVDGELVLDERSLLWLRDENAKVNGYGSIKVEGDFDSIDCKLGEVTADIVPPERKVIDGITTVGGIVIANKAITLTPEYGDHLYPDAVESWVQSALDEMNSASYEAIGHVYSNLSGYRSYYSQQAIFANYVSIYGYEEADTFSSQAGHSEHQTGLTMDLDSFVESYINTTEGRWLADNCYRFGFIIRYPKGKDDITGYTYEPWHVRWLGKSTAKLVYTSGLTLEEFLNVEGGKVVMD